LAANGRLRRLSGVERFLWIYQLETVRAEVRQLRRTVSVKGRNTQSVGLTGSYETGNGYKSTVGGNIGYVRIDIDNPATQADSHDADV